MRALKLVGIVVGCLVALVIIVLLAVRLFVNPNDYKDRIAQQVKSATGRELILSGPIRLSVFPWIALELGPGHQRRHGVDHEHVDGAGAH